MSRNRKPPVHLGHLDLLSGADPEEVLGRMLASMSAEDASRVMKFASEHAAKQTEAASRASTREGLIENFRSSKEQIRQLYRDEGASALLTTTQSDNVKPAAGKGKRVPPVASCAPLTVQSMALGATHRHRHLCGTVAEGDSFRQIRHIYFLLEDLRGDLVRACVYNTDRTFRLGEAVAIVEPFYKVAADAIPVVRVDDPEEIVKWEPPATALQWKDLGDGFARADGFADALFCYEAGMNAADGPSVRSETSTLLTNIALCDFNLRNMKSSVWYAGAAVFLDHANKKAWYRLLAALSEVDKASFRKVARASPDVPELKGLIDRALPKATSEPHVTSKLEGLAAWSQIHFSWSMAPDLTSTRAASETRRDRTTIREQARSLFVKKAFEEARGLYIEAVKSYGQRIADLATLASIMSSVLQKLGRMGDASIVVAASILLDRTKTQTWVRGADIAESIHGPERALAMLETLRAEAGGASTSNPFTKRCEKKIEELKAKRDHKRSVAAVGDRSTDEQLRDRRTREYEEREKDYDQYIARMEFLVPQTKRMISQMPANYQLLRAIRILSQRKVPRIDIELPKYTAWPAGFDTQRGAKMLRIGYLDASNNPWNMAFMMAEGAFPVSDVMLLKRWHGPERAQVFRRRRHELAFGDIVDVGPRVLKLYDPTIRSVFVNTPPNPLMKLRCGSVHVSIGFNDLGEILSNQFLEPSHVGVVPTRPLRFVGVDQSEFAVARSLVTKELLLDAKVPLPTVFQVWYSAGWTKAALQAFRKACHRLMEEPQGPCRHEIVRSYLSCWLTEEPISAAESRVRFFRMDENRPSKLISDSCSFHRLADRISILHYMMTGELIPALKDPTADSPSTPDPCSTKVKSRGKSKKKVKSVKATGAAKISREPADVGSLLFWTTPPNSAPLESDVFFNTISMETLLEHWNHSESCGSSGKKRSNLVDDLIRIKLEQLGRLRSRLLNGEVVIDLRCGRVAIQSEEDGGDDHKHLYDRDEGMLLIHELARLEPESVSWSNLMDYSRLSAFHGVARRLGAKRHYGYSMNWITEVYGASMIDFLMLDDDDVTKTSRVRQILARALKEPPSSQQHPLLTRPLFDTPLNLAGNLLASEQALNWIRLFEDESSRGTGKRGQARVVSQAMLEEFPMYRISTTQYLEWTYGEAHGDCSNLGAASSDPR